MTRKLMMMAMAIAVFSFAEGGRIRNDGSSSERLKGTMAGMDLHEQVKHAAEQVDTMLADADVHDQLLAFEKELTENPQLQQQLEAMMEDPSLQKQIASVQKQMEAMKVESPSAPSLLEVSESSGGQANPEPWKAMAAALLLTNPSFAFRLGMVSRPLRSESAALGKTDHARPFPTMLATGDTDMMLEAETELKDKAEAEAVPDVQAEPDLKPHSKPPGRAKVGRAVAPSRASVISMNDIWKTIRAPELSVDCLLLPHEPYPGTPHLDIVGEAMLLELENDEETRTQIFLNADGTITPGKTDGPPPAGFCGVWQCGAGQYQMTISRGFSSPPSIYRLTRDVETKGMGNIQYTVVRTFQGNVDPSSTGEGFVNGRIDLITDEDREGWSNTTATSIAMYDKLNIDTPPIGSFVLDSNTELELKQPRTW